MSDFVALLGLIVTLSVSFLLDVGQGTLEAQVQRSLAISPELWWGIVVDLVMVILLFALFWIVLIPSQTHGLHNFAVFPDRGVLRCLRAADLQHHPGFGRVSFEPGLRPNPAGPARPGHRLQLSPGERGRPGHRIGDSDSQASRRRGLSLRHVCTLTQIWTRSAPYGMMVGWRPNLAEPAQRDTHPTLISSSSPQSTEADGRHQRTGASRAEG